jgi:hypothetical protein
MPTDGRDRRDRAAGWKPCCLKGGNQLVWHSAYLKPVPRAEAIAPAYTSWIGSRGRSCLAERAPRARQVRRSLRTKLSRISFCELIDDLTVDAGQTAGDSLVAGVGTRPGPLVKGGGRPR